MKTDIKDRSVTERCRIINADVLDGLRSLPAESVHCVVTSPPYWGLRDYGVAGQLGLEPTPAAHICAMLEVFREVWRVLRKDGTCWINYGDSYSNDTKWGGTSGGKNYTSAAGGYQGQRRKRKDLDPKRGPAAVGQPLHHGNSGLKPKDLVGMPWRLALALQEDGWWLRSDIIWHKPNPMPESVTDRPVKAHEYLFLLAKAERYFYDAEAIREGDCGRPSGNGFVGRQGNSSRVGPLSGGEGTAEEWKPGGGRNRRSVWTIATEPFPDAHFATFPTDLVRPCILAGTSEKGVCFRCGAPWVRQVDKQHVNPGNRSTSGPRSTQNRTFTGGFMARKETVTETTGWAPSCKCGVDFTVPATVLDPFMGSGTTGVVALGHSRHFIGIELNPAYVALAEKRLGKEGLFGAEIVTEDRRPEAAAGLFDLPDEEREGEAIHA